MVEHSIFRKESNSSQGIETAQAASKSRDTVAGTSGYVAPPADLTYQEAPRREPQQCYAPGLLAAPLLSKEGPSYWSASFFFSFASSAILRKHVLRPLQDTGMGWTSLTAEAGSRVLQSRWHQWEEAKVTVFAGDICLAVFCLFVSHKILLYNLGYIPLSSWASLCLLPQTSRSTVLAHGCLFWKQLYPQKAGKACKLEVFVEMCAPWT